MLSKVSCVLSVQEETLLHKIIQSADAWMRSARDMVENVNKATLLAAQDLLKSAEAIPVFLRNKAFLEERVQGAS